MIPLPELLLRATATPRAPWLFPGQKAGQPTHPAHLSRAPTASGVPMLPARSSALAALSRFPAPVLAELLGLHAHTIANASAQLKADYAAYVARRT